MSAACACLLVCVLCVCVRACTGATVSLVILALARDGGRPLVGVGRTECPPAPRAPSLLWSCVSRPLDKGRRVEEAARERRAVP